MTARSKDVENIKAAIKEIEACIEKCDKLRERTSGLSLTIALSSLQMAQKHLCRYLKSLNFIIDE